MSAIPSGEKSIPEILRECKDLMKNKNSISDSVKQLQHSLRKARYRSYSLFTLSVQGTQ